MAAMHLLETFTFATFCVFLPTVPVTHSLGLLAHCPPAARLRHILLYPIKGGRHHFIFQVISWVRPCLWLPPNFLGSLLHPLHTFLTCHPTRYSGARPCKVCPQEG